MMQKLKQLRKQLIGTGITLKIAKQRDGYNLGIHLLNPSYNDVVNAIDKAKHTGETMIYIHCGIRTYQGSEITA